MKVLEVKNLTKSFFSPGLFSKKSHLVLDSVSFALTPGKVTGFLGANGSGKTSALKCILGLTTYSKGQVRFFNNSPLSRSILKKIGFLPEQPSFYEHATGEEILMFYGKLSSLKTSDLKSKTHSLLKKFQLFAFKDKKLKTFSRGMLQKIGLIQALLHNPRLIILDEPLSGLDPLSRLLVGEILEERKKAGATIFFTSHLLHDVEKLCDFLIVLKNKKITFQGPTFPFLSQNSYRHCIMYLEKDQKKIAYADNLSECQKKIDQLRAQKKLILNIQLDNVKIPL